MVSRGTQGKVWRAFAAALAIAAGAARATGEEASRRTWFAGTQAGVFELHHRNGAGGALRVGGDVSRHVALDIGLGLARRDGFQFASSDLGVTVRLCDRCLVTPFLVGNAGVLAEAEWGGPWVGGGAGVAARIGAHDSLSVTVRAAVHDGYNGPMMVAAGWTHRFRRGQGGVQ